MDEILARKTEAIQQYYSVLYPGHRITKIRCEQEHAHLYLEPTAPAICPVCGEICHHIHERIYREIREVALIGQSFCTLHLYIRRVRCEKCGSHRQEQIPWLESKKRITKYLAVKLQSELRKEQQIKSLSVKHKLAWSTISKLDKEQLEYYFDKIELSDLRYLAMDEFSIKKGHSYATGFMNLETGKMVHVCEGRSIEKVRPFFELLDSRGLTDQIQMVCVDMHAGFHKLVKEYLPQATVVYDLFHVMQHFNKDVLKPAVGLCSKLFEQAHGSKGKRGYRRKLRKTAWFIMAADSSPLKQKNGKEHYEEILRDNELLFMLQPVVDMLRGIWNAENEIEAANRLDELIDLLDTIKEKFNFKAVTKFKNMLATRAKEIVRACLYKGYGTNRIEGANAKIKNIKRAAYGFRDMEYFFLKIKAALPGDGWDAWNYLTDQMGIINKIVCNTGIYGVFISSSLGP